MSGQGAARRANARKAKQKREAKKAAKRAARDGLVDSQGPSSFIPTVTEDDLLSFQLAHFGDDTKPDIWFVDAETALGYQPELQEDDLGYYEDGVKRTLTDEQIEMFRHTELELLKREERRRREEEDALLEEQHLELEPRAAPPISDTSSLEPELVGVARQQSPSPPPPPPRRTSQNSRSVTPHSANGTRRQRKEEVPYEQRHKRKWEDYIEDNDPVEGSITHRRLIRQLDDQQRDSVELDY